MSAVRKRVVWRAKTRQRVEWIEQLFVGVAIESVRILKCEFDRSEKTIPSLATFSHSQPRKLTCVTSAASSWRTKGPAAGRRRPKRGRGGGKRRSARYEVWHGPRPCPKPSPSQ